jgi:uncharacterized protein with von Willebrand factor type A (vWA) domain
MTLTILQFSWFLRFSGLIVPTSSILNAIQALELINPLEKDIFFYALQGCLVDKPSDRNRFKNLFRRFFVDKNPLDFEQLRAETKLQIKKFIDSLKGEKNQIDMVLSNFLEGNIVEFLCSLEPTEGNKSEKKPLTKPRIVKKGIKRAHVEDKIKEFAKASYHISREEREKLEHFLINQLDKTTDLIEQTNPPLRRRGGYLLPWEKQRTLAAVSFDKMTLKEHQIIKESVEKLAHQLNDALNKRNKKATRGAIDVKCTIRHSIRFGGIPFEIKRKSPPKKKTKIVALCDISMSVSHTAQLMLLLLYRLQNRFSKIRSFVFVRDAYEISQFFQRHSLEVALEKAVEKHKIGLGQLTNYGVAFKSFLDRYSTALTKDTTLIVLGDGQNNQIDPQVETMKKIREKVRRTIWLNPEEKKYWCSKTNVTYKYSPYCDHLVECATLEQLSDFARKLVL